jgi:hypothetical protein
MSLLVWWVERMDDVLVTTPLRLIDALDKGLRLDSLSFCLWNFLISILFVDHCTRCFYQHFWQYVPHLTRNEMFAP